MKCYYEILEVSREADDNEIKTSYRKLALRWHPDKNIDNTEVAKEQFQLVQQAYEVLSDRQERAWYDNHREQILRGSDSNFKDDSLDVFPYFTTQCFKGYGDDAKGFYTVYRTVFEQILKEDIEYIDSKSDYDEVPTFGISTSNYDDIVGPFYAYWMGYSTRKSYVWLDPYNIKEARERRVLKMIEKENKKVRQKAKKERNEEIRNLVAFVRKRDKRVQAYAKFLETKNAENRQKQEQLRKQKLLERKKDMDNDSAQADWSRFHNVQKELQQIEKNLAEQFGECISDSASNSENEECEDLYCVACNKIFKNPKAFANHESSKKHRENFEKLKIRVLEEEEEFVDIDSVSSNSEEPISRSTNNKKKNGIRKQTKHINKKIELSDSEINKSDDSDLESYIEESISQSLKKKNKRQKNDIVTQDTVLSDPEIKVAYSSDVVSNIEESNNQSSKKENQNKNIRKQSKDNHEVTHISDLETKVQNEDTESDSEETLGQSSKKRNKKNKVIRLAERTSESNDINSTINNVTDGKSLESDDDFDFNTSKKQKKKNSKSKNSKNITIKKTDDKTNITDTSEANRSNPVMTKLHKKIKVSKNKDPIDLEDLDLSHCCASCKSSFNSKNKLFDHLKKTGHSVMLPQKTSKSRKKQVKECRQKLVNPSAERNKSPILEILKKYLTIKTPGNLLEISSGTGQHVAYFAPYFPNITFQPSEYDKSMLPHIQMYIDSCTTRNIKTPLHIDVRTPNEIWGLSDNREFDYILNVNMIHISPFSCTESLFKNASILLKPGALLITYGAYGNNGIIEPESNVRFDKLLRSQNSEWGIRDIALLKEIAQNNGIQLCEIHDMPANNKCLIWKKL